MKNNFQTLFAKRLVVILLGFTALVGCKGIPNAYLGLYKDSSRQVELELSTYEAKLRLADGRKLSAKLEEMKFELLIKGQRALYARPNGRNEDLVEIFMVDPNLSTRQEANGLIWYESEIVYTLVNSKDESAAKNISLAHCQRGMVLLDLATNRIRIGCPENPDRFELTKTRDDSRNDDEHGGP